MRRFFLPLISLLLAISLFYVSGNDLKTVSAADLPAPLSAGYVLENDHDGFADGTITVTVPTSCINYDVELFWGKADGKRLSGYSHFMKFVATGTKSVVTVPKGSMIPPKARNLLVYLSRAGKLSDPVTVPLPKDSAPYKFGMPKHVYTICSDVHLSRTNNINSEHFNAMLTDIAICSDFDCEGIFVVGDCTGVGAGRWSNEETEDDYRYMFELYENAKAHYSLPQMFIAIGNHDLGLGYNEDEEALNRIFLKYASKPDGSHPAETFYDFYLNGSHFIFLGNDQLGSNRCDAYINQKHLRWLDDTIKAGYGGNSPTFIFLHQPLPETVAGSLEGQGWGHIDARSLPALKNILAKYPKALMFNGHTHWELDSECNSYIGDPELPSAFNCGAVGCEWTTYGNTHSEGAEKQGSEGYTVEVYPDKVLVRGRDYVSHTYKASAFYCIPNSHTHTAKYNLDGGTMDEPNPDSFTDSDYIMLNSPKKEGYTFDGWYTDEYCTEKVEALRGISDLNLYAGWTSDTPVPSEESGDSGSFEDSGNSGTPTTSEDPDTGTSGGTSKKKKGCGASAASLLPLAGLSVLGFVLIRRRKTYKG